MHHDEMWQVYAPNGEAIPGKGWESSLDNPEVTGADEIVGCAIVFFYRVNQKGVLELLWQRRSLKVDRYPGKYDISASGHINLGETIVEGAIRECREEIGAEVGPDDLYFATMSPYNKNRFAWIFMVDWTGKEESFHFDDEEVSEVKWVPFSETQKFCEDYVKEPIRNDKVTFPMIEGWFRMHGYLDGDI